MSKSKFSHVRIAGITGVVPEHGITIDDEIRFYGGDEKALNRNKKSSDSARDRRLTRGV